MWFVKRCDEACVQKEGHCAKTCELLTSCIGTTFNSTGASSSQICSPHDVCTTTRTVTMPAPSPHKPRRKVKKVNGSDTSSAVVPTRSTTAKPTYPLASLLWPARTSVSQWEILPMILMVVGLFRWAAGLWGYSGILNAGSHI